MWTKVLQVLQLLGTLIADLWSRKRAEEAAETAFKKRIDQLEENQMAERRRRIEAIREKVKNATAADAAELLKRTTAKDSNPSADTAMQHPGPREPT